MAAAHSGTGTLHVSCRERTSAELIGLKNNNEQLDEDPGSCGSDQWKVVEVPSFDVLARVWANLIPRQ
jgi:hypothetical protein